MSLVVSPSQEVLTTSRGNLEEPFLNKLTSNQRCSQLVQFEKNECHSPYDYDPLLRFIDLDDFRNDEKLQKNFEEVLRVHKMGFPVTILKRHWFPGLICIPVFHCQRCLSLWTEGARVPTLCSEANRSVYGRMIPISITKCDILTKLFRHNWKSTTARETVPKVVVKVSGTSIGISEDEKRAHSKSRSRKLNKVLPVAEFVDIDELIRKCRERISRKTAVQQLLSGSNGYRQFGYNGRTEENSVLASEADDISAKDGPESNGQKDDGPELREQADTSRSSQRCASSLSCRSRESRSGYCERPPTRASANSNKPFKGDLSVHGEQRGDRAEMVSFDSYSDQRVKRRELRPRTRRYDSVKLTPPTSSPCADNENSEIKDSFGLDKLPKNAVEFDEEISKDFLIETAEKTGRSIDTLMDEISVEPAINQRAFKWDLTRAFRFSYFTLLRKVKR